MHDCASKHTCKLHVMSRVTFHHWRTRRERAQDRGLQFPESLECIAFKLVAENLGIFKFIVPTTFLHLPASQSALTELHSFNDFIR